MTVQFIADQLNIPIGSIKTTIIRLVEKGFIKRDFFKNGRGGWSSFEIPDVVYRELLQHEGLGKLNTNLTQTDYKLDTKVNTQLNTNTLYSSSININTTTTEIEIIVPREL